MRHFAISAANFSISTLFLQKQHRFKHKRQFSQVHKHKNQIKTILHTNLKLRHVTVKRRVIETSSTGFNRVGKAE